ncbi:unnamed protein product, partial [Darwinula stevensoni]
MSLGSERDNTDPCFPNPCGAHAKCRASGGHPVCSCIYYGNPETSCFKGECVETHDCSDDRVCKDFYCTDPCPGTCGRGAQCIVRRHVPVCTCPAGHTGDPFEQCRRLGPEELCDPSPCGRNSKCEVALHLAICSCLPHFFGNPVQGCRAECETDSACAQTQECRLYKCVNPCTDACGEKAECRVEHHRAICSCPKGSERDNTDPCFPDACGAHAKCRASGGHPVCTCIYYGNPETSCFKGECVETHDCSDDRVCNDFYCTDPCPGTCGTGAQCIVRRHVPACTCPAGHTGDPFEGCRRLGPEELCDPSPCGRNSKCEVAFHLAICSCLPHFFGNPVQGCRAECETDSACAQTQECRLHKCVNPCTDACGEKAECRVEHHRAICSCPKDFLGDPRIRCYAECTVHEECAYHQACINFRCTDPCVGACGMNAECRVENHKPICSCPKGFTG